MHTYYSNVYVENLSKIVMKVCVEYNGLHVEQLFFGEKIFLRG